MPRSLFFLVLIVVMASLSSCETSTDRTDVTYLEGILSPDEVIKPIVGRDIADTYAKKIAALRCIEIVISVYALDRSLSNEEESVSQAYWYRKQELGKEFGRISGGKKSVLWKQADKLYGTYRDDEEFNNSIRSRCLSAKVNMQYQQRLKELNLRTEMQVADHVKNAQQRVNNGLEEERRRDMKMRKFFKRTLPTASVGLAITAASFFLFMSGYRKAKQVNKTVFEKTNQYGVAQFQSFEESVKLQRSGYYAGQRMKWGLPFMIIGVLIIIVAFT